MTLRKNKLVQWNSRQIKSKDTTLVSSYADVFATGWVSNTKHILSSELIQYLDAVLPVYVPLQRW